MVGAADSPDLRTTHALLDRVSDVLVAIADALVIFDAYGRAVLANGAAQELFSLDSNPELQVLSMEERARRLNMRTTEGKPLDGDEIPGARALSGEEATGANAVDIRFTSPRGQELEMNVTAMPIRAESGEIIGAVCVYRDVTHRRALERSFLAERDRLHAVLDELRAVESNREEFLSSFSHDLKNPLTSLRGMAQLVHRQLSRGTFELEPGLRHLESMIETTGTMTRMVDELVQTSRRRLAANLKLDRRPVDLVALTRSFVALQQPVVDQDIIVECDLPELVAHVDESQFERVVSNLVWNAVKYSSRRSCIWVCLGVEHNMAMLSVRDEGIGIPPDELPHIFERFYRARNVDPGVSGNGVGLVSVQEIVQAHGGSIEVESTEGKGSAFTVRLPLEI